MQGYYLQGEASTRIDHCVIDVHETTVELEMHDIDHPIISQCRKHRQLVHLKGGFAACFPLDVLMVHSSTLTIATTRECLTCGGFSLGETIHFGSLEFITDYFNSMSLSPGGATQVPSSWEQPTMGCCHCGP
jgi:hypothetical protein